MSFSNVVCRINIRRTKLPQGASYSGSWHEVPALSPCMLLMLSVAQIAVFRTIKKTISTFAEGGVNGATMASIALTFL